MNHLKNCICEYCCSVQDEKDDKLMQLEYDAAEYTGQQIFDQLSIGDTIQYYHISHQHKNIVYTNNLQYIQQYATTTQQAIITSKQNKQIFAQTFNNTIINFNISECKLHYIHKI